jgi:hypothetical protein
MRVCAQFSDPGKINATITITTTLDRWKQLSDDLKDAPYYGVAGDLRSAITDLQLKLMGQIGYEPPTKGEASDDPR